MASQVVQWWRICLPMQQTQGAHVWAPSQEDPLEKEMATHSSRLAWKISLLASSISPGKWDLYSTLVDKKEPSLLPSPLQHTSLGLRVLPALCLSRVLEAPRMHRVWVPLAMRGHLVVDRGQRRWRAVSGLQEPRFWPLGLLLSAQPWLYSLVLKTEARELICLSLLQHPRGPARLCPGSSRGFPAPLQHHLCPHWSERRPLLECSWRFLLVFCVHRHALSWKWPRLLFTAFPLFVKISTGERDRWRDGGPRKPDTIKVLFSSGQPGDKEAVTQSLHSEQAGRAVGPS